VRLGGCILLELALGATLAAGVGVVAFHAKQAAASFLGQAHAGRLEIRPQLGRLRAAEVPDLLPPNGYFLGVKDEILLTPLAGDIARAKFNRGGSSISLRLDFLGGGRAAFKPDQTMNGQFPRMEVAAYRLDRLIGLNAVSPAIPVQFRLDEVLGHLDDSSRDIVPRILAEVPTDEAGVIVGELQWWIPVIKDAEIDGVLLDGPEGMRLWKRYLKVGEPEPYEARHLLPQISNMIVFDYLINNRDRWSGANCKASPDRRTLYFMDHTLAFGSEIEPEDRVRAMLVQVQKFSRSLVRRLRRLDPRALRAAMTTHTAPYTRILTDVEIDGVLHRRQALLAYVDGLVAEHGPDAVLVYP
jgi:Golgi casein kinase, C-terminal, Fam20